MSATYGPIDRTTLNSLSPNLDVGDVADPALRLAFFQYLADYGDAMYSGVKSDISGLINAGTLSRLGIINVKDYGAKGDGITNDTVTIQSAIDAANAAGGGIVFFPPGTYIINGTLNIPANITIQGSGRGVTVFKRTAEGDIAHIFGTIGNVKKNIIIQGITFEMNNQVNSTGLYMTFVENVIIRDCEFKNMDHWGIWIGVLDGTDTQNRNSNIIIEYCLFDNCTLTYEHILIFNAQDVYIRNCVIENGSNSNGIGIYQVSDRITIEDVVITNISNGVYYSQSTNNITIINADITHCDTGIQGANQSDNGAFGATKVNGFHINGGIIAHNVIGIKLGALRGSTVAGVMLEYNTENAVVIFQGNPPVNSNSDSINIKNCIFRNNNAGAGPSLLHPGILFSSGNTMYATIEGCQFYDDQTVSTQLYPIAFQNAQTYNDVIISNCRLSSYGGAQSVGSGGGATIGTNVKVVYCMDVSAENAAGVVVV